ncbi:3-phosphoglycerate kinase [Aquipseudomonas campi]
MKKLCIAVIALLPLTAFAYPIEVEKQLNGAEVSATGQDVDSDIGSIMLYNYGRQAASCTAIFRNGPEAPRTRRTELAPGQTSNLTVKFARNIIKLRISLTCVQK